MKTKQEIISELIEYISRGGGYYRDWYIGIASNPRERLFNAHNVDVNNYGWTYEECLDHNLAREIEQYFIDQGMDGGPGGGDDDTRFVYAYKKTVDTNENV